MKTKLSILLLVVVAMVSAVSAQRVRPAGYESIYFDREDYISATGDTVIYLYEKGNKFEPKKIGMGNFIPGAFEFGKDYLSAFQSEFPDLNYPDDLKQFYGIEVCFWTDYEGNVTSFYYQLPSSDKLSLYPDLEKHLYELAAKVKKEGLQKYDVRSFEPDVYSRFYYQFGLLHRLALKNRP